MNCDYDISHCCLYCRKQAGPRYSLNCSLCKQCLHPECQGIPFEIFKSGQKDLYCSYCESLVIRLNAYEQHFSTLETNVKLLLETCEKLTDNFEFVSF